MHRIKILTVILILASCSPPLEIHKLDNESLKALLGKRITITGKAANAKLGALLETEDGNIIWMDDKDSWPEGYYLGEDNRKTLKVTGTVIEKYDKPVFIPNKEDELARSGIPVPEGTDLKKASHRFLLKNIKWEIIKE